MLRISRFLRSGVAFGKISRQYVTAGDIDESLRNDVKMLGKILGGSINKHDPKVFNTVEELRLLGREVSKFYML